MIEQFVITEDQLKQQLIDVTHWISNHRVLNDPEARIITTDGPRTPHQVVYYLATKRWVDSFYPLCEVPDCITGIHFTPDQAHSTRYWATVQAAQDEVVLQAIETHQVSLADLYRKGKARGLLTGRTLYH